MKVIQRSLVGYLPTLEATKAFNAIHTAETEDELQAIGHSPASTQGLAGELEHLSVRGDTSAVQIGRGSQITYHGPRQLIVYTMIDSKRYKTSVRCTASALENSIISILPEYGIRAAADPGRPGVYVDGRKIASLGLRIRNDLVYHGLALNVNMNLSPFTHINPRGYAGMEMVQITDFVHPRPSLAEVAGEPTGHLQRELNSRAMAGDEKNRKTV